MAGVMCSAGAICKGIDSRPALVGVCSAAVEDGAPCADPLECSYPSRCISGKCKTAAEEAPSCR
jgi:hypothetical protein